MAFLAPNPHGEISADALKDLEREMAGRLPSGYREYLLSHNGASFSKDLLPIHGDCVRIHHVYGLHDGPRFLRLQENWRLSDRYALERWRKKLADFVCFAETSTGDLLALKQSDGSVWLYEHDVAPGLFNRMAGRFAKVSDDFTSFLTCLKSEAEYLDEDPGHDDFRKRIEELKAQRTARVREK